MAPVKMPAWAVNILVLFVSLAVALGFLEFISGKFLTASRPAPLPRVLIHEASPNLKLLYQPVPGASNIAYMTLNRINGLGFRGEEYQYVKPAETIRIIFLGDSVVYGFGVQAPEAIPQQLEVLFRKNGQKVEVMNFGVCGYGTEQAVEFLKARGLPLQPDIVLLGYTLNDSMLASLEVTLLHENFRYEVPADRRDFFSRMWDWLFTHSRLFMLMDQRWEIQKRFRIGSHARQGILKFLEENNSRRRDLPDSPYRRLEPEIRKMAEDARVPEADLRKMLDFAGFQNDGLHSSHWGVSRAAVSELVALGRERNFKVIAVVFPFVMDMKDYPLAPLHRFLCDEFKSLGAGCIDLLETGKKIEKELGREGSADSIHFSGKGSALLAKDLYNDLGKMGIK